MMVEGKGQGRIIDKGHRPTFTRAHTKDEKRRIGEGVSKATKGKPKPNGTLSQANIDGIRRGINDYWKRRRAQQAQEAHNAPGEETIFTPGTNNEQPK
jgi:hypothetical protein